MAVLGIKPESMEAAYLTPLRAQQAGIEVVPVPVYYPEATEILGQKVYRRLVDIPGDLDLVNVFRRPEHIPQHVPDIIARHPKAVWFQLGIRNDEAAEQLARAGIDVVQDQCVERELIAMGR
ncbi:MAG: CoA-binding protein [Gemmatimonadetes bacterium]|nr:CoA-binding protein [Gemmatimonadota bacterium]